ncbi:hypothetical protein TNCV_3320561 [Trichonephila clavipes]|nr:hypothetical protein TNCV_3320561 [Trichonephila clavipes]
MPSCHSVHDLELAVQVLWAHLPQNNIRCLINSMLDRGGTKAVCTPSHDKNETSFSVDQQRTCKAFLPDMMAENKGHIVSIASLAGIAGATRLTDYCASKFAAVGFEESLRLELYDEGYTGIHSTVVCPFFINTGMFDGANSGIFAMLEPEYVADEIVASVLVNKEVVIIPSYFLILVILKTKPDEDVDTTLLFSHSVAQGVCRNACDGHRNSALSLV